MQGCRCYYKKLSDIYKIFLCLSAFKCCGCNYLLGWETSWFITWNVFSFSHILLDLQKFLVMSDCICNLPNYVFLRKAMTGVALNTFPSILLIFNICQCRLIASLIFDKVRLFVTKNVITFFRIASDLFNRIFFNFFELVSNDVFFYPFSTSHLTKLFECFLYTSKVEQTRFTLNAWL